MEKTTTLMEKTTQYIMRFFPSKKMEKTTTFFEKKWKKPQL